MVQPAVQYVTTRDDINVAYTVSGAGRPFVYVPNLVSHALLNWERPAIGRWMRALAERFRLVTYDSRGSGMSTRGLRQDHSFDDYQLDLEAVIDCLHLEDFVLFGQGSGVQIAVRYATQHPERVTALVLLGASLSVQSRRAGELMFRALPEQDWDMFLHTIARTSSPENVAATVDILRQSVTQEEWLLSRSRYKDDSEAVFRQLRTPSLVLHQRNFFNLPIEASMEVAQLSRGQLFVIDGSDFLGDETQAIAAIETFLAGLPNRGSASNQPAGQGIEGLSARELEVLRLIAVGRSNLQIADELVLSVNTVQRHISNIFSKTGAANRTEAAGYARDHGLI
jgi:pimeloyl-ACP methyl ester carboxylesterase/DNA-binding CsgD family transcriptional regulator